ncbi:hypothetical protein ACROYT_G009930 [Oculina patagonica]
MSFFFIGLFLVAFQVTCHGAPERLFPVPQLPVDVSQEKTDVEKRALCTDDQLDQSSGCTQWAAAGYCAESSPYHNFMQSTCYASCGNCEVPPTPVPVVDEDACLQAHNSKRALHQNTPALVWDATLAQDAKDWADHLAEQCSSVASCADAVQSWYNEVSLYDYNDPPQTTQEFYAGGYGHFTQVIWKGTTHVGAALKKITDSNGYTETYIVARYSPQGNIIGHFDTNVKQLK